MQYTTQTFVTVLLLGFTAGVAPAQQKAPTVGLNLYASVTRVAPGEAFDAAVQFEIPEGFHIYWENPGDSGMAPKVTWTLPAGFTAGPLRFPMPETHETSGLVTYILKDKPILLTTITPPVDLAPGKSVEIKGKVSWLACKEACFRGEREVSITLATAASAEPVAGDKELVFKVAQRMQPTPAGKGKYVTIVPSVTHQTLNQGTAFDVTLAVTIKPGFHTQSNKPLSEFFVPMGVFIRPLEGLTFEQPLWPEAHVRNDRTLGRLSEFTGTIRVTVPGKMVAPTTAKDVTIRGLLKYQACNEKGQCFPPEAVEWSVAVTSQAVREAAGEPVTAGGAGHTEITDARPASPGDDATTDAGADPAPETAGADADADFKFITIGEEGGGKIGLWGAVLFGLLGGLILNIMPCVLPVISIKVLSFVQQANEDPRRVFHLGLIFSAGIVVSFWALAAGILILQVTTGADQSWGAFFQHPEFVIAMLVVIFAFALNLFGVFEVALPGRAATRLAGASDSEGATGAFMKGVLATLLATPCTAPLLAPAISFALASPRAYVFIIFTAAGLGMALPYVLLTARPAWMKYIPKPGPWMVGFKQFMGFLLAGTAVWLLVILGRLTDVDGMTGAVALLAFLGVALWLFGRVQFGASIGKKVAGYIGAVAVVLGGAWFSYGLARPVQSIEWMAYRAGLPEELAAEGHTVYVDYTAAWCATCQVNKKVAFGSDRVLRKFEDYNVVAVRADYTKPDIVMAKDLKKFERNAVPLNVVYPAGGGLPIRLPVVLTPSIVIDAVEMAGPSQK